MTFLPPSPPLQVLAVPAFSDNYIWLITDATADAEHGTADVIAVDPGQAQPVIDVLDARGWRLTAILLTHHHADHVGGVSGLLAHAGVALPVYGPAGENIAAVTVPLADGDTVDIATPAAHFRVIDVPGHTAGHIAYVLDDPYGGAPNGESVAPASESGASAVDGAARPWLFCGDTLFATGCGRLFEGTPAQMRASLDRLGALPAATAVYCAHEYTQSNIRFALACDADNADLLAWRDRAAALRARGEPTIPTTIADELRVNPFLRVTQPGIAARLTERLGRAPHDRDEAFATLRRWKDEF